MGEKDYRTVQNAQNSGDLSVKNLGISDPMVAKELLGGNVPIEEIKKDLGINPLGLDPENALSSESTPCNKCHCHYCRCKGNDEKVEDEMVIQSTNKNVEAITSSAAKAVDDWHADKTEKLGITFLGSASVIANDIFNADTPKPFVIVDNESTGEASSSAEDTDILDLNWAFESPNFDQRILNLVAFGQFDTAINLIHKQMERMGGDLYSNRWLNLMTTADYVSDSMRRTGVSDYIKMADQLDYSTARPGSVVPGQSEPLGDISVSAMMALNLSRNDITPSQELASSLADELINDGSDISLFSPDIFDIASGADGESGPISKADLGQHTNTGLLAKVAADETIEDHLEALKLKQGLHPSPMFGL